MSDRRVNWPLRCGVGLLCLAGILVVAPDLVAPVFDPAALDDQLSGDPLGRLVGSVLLLGAIAAGWSVRRRSDASPPSVGGTAASSAPDSVASPTLTADERRAAGAVDAGATGQTPAAATGQTPGGATAFSPAADEGDDTGVRAGWAHDRAGETEADRLESRLRTVAAEAIETYESCEPARARDRVAAGDWTDDRIAASYLGGGSAPDAPLTWRLRRWFFPGRTSERAIERTIAAVERIQGGEQV